MGLPSSIPPDNHTPQVATHHMVWSRKAPNLRRRLSSRSPKAFPASQPCLGLIDIILSPASDSIIFNVPRFGNMNCHQLTIQNTTSICCYYYELMHISHVNRYTLLFWLITYYAGFIFYSYTQFVLNIFVSAYFWGEIET